MCVKQGEMKSRVREVTIATQAGHEGVAELRV